MNEESRRPTVLMIGPSLTSRGGMASVERQFFDAGIRNKYDVRFIASYDDGSKLRKGWIAAMAFARFGRLLPTCHIVHVHMASNASFDRKRIFLRAAKAAGKKTIVHLHGGRFAEFFEDSSKKKQDEIRRTFNEADAVVVLSPEWQSYVRRRICDSDKVSVLRNSVPVPHSFEIPHPPGDVLFLGRLGEVKRPDVLLRAARIVLRDHPDVLFRFGGDGEVRAYTALAKELGIEASCEFLGWVSGKERERLFQESSIFCLPSEAEGMPMSILEAMAHGLATIATPVGGIPEIIDDGTNGLIMQVGGYEHLAELIGRLLDNPDLAERIARQGRQTVVEHFNQDACIEKLERLYGSLLVGAGD